MSRAAATGAGVVAPAAWLFIAACIGVGAAHQFAWPPIVWACAALVTALWGKVHLHWGFPRSEWIVLLAFLCTAGQLAAQQAEKYASWLEIYPEGKVVLEVRVVGASEDGTWLVKTIRPRRESVRLWVRPSRNSLTVAADLACLTLGSVVRITGDLVHTRPAGNPGEFDARAYYLRQGVIGTAYVDSIAFVGGDEATQTLGQRVPELLDRIRSNVRDQILAASSERAGPILLGMLIGDRSRIADDTTHVVQRAGVSHLLSVSGLHVGLVAGTVWMLASAFRLRGWSRYAASLLVVVVYVVITGGRPSAVRAGIMSALGMTALQLDRRTDPLHFWGLAGLGLILMHPALLGDVGFQLSFAASGAILWWLRPVRHEAHPNSWATRLYTSARVTWAAQVGTVGLVAYHFNELSIAGLIVNLLVVPLAAPVVSLSALGAVLGAVWEPAGRLLIGGAGGIMDLILPLLDWTGSQGFAAIEVAAPTPPVLVAWAAAAIGLPLLQARGRERRIGLRLCLCALLCLLPPVWGPLVHAILGRVEVVFIDVGQGDAILIRTPLGRTALIDGGGMPRDPQDEGFFDVGARRLVPYLQHIGVRRLDLVVNTHPHDDHLQGLLAVLQQRSVRFVTDPGDSVETVAFEVYRDLVEASRADYRAAQRGDVFQLEPGVHLHVIHPTAGWEGPGGLNDRSLVIRLETRHGNVLLTGDLERSGQQELLWGDEKVELASQVIKVPHHGSQRDLELRFIDAVRPEVAVITVGRNRFGHPSSRVEQAYSDRGARVYRTDRHGAVTVTLTGRGVRVRTFRSDADVP